MTQASRRSRGAMIAADLELDVILVPAYAYLTANSSLGRCATGARGCMIRR